MKNLLLSAIALSAATLTFAPVANAAEVFPSSVQQRRLEFLDTQSKAVGDIQKVRLEHLDTQSKAVDDIQATRLEFLDSQSKAVSDIQKTRLEHLNPPSAL